MPPEAVCCTGLGIGIGTGFQSLRLKIILLKMFVFVTFVSVDALFPGSHVILVWFDTNMFLLLILVVLIL